MYIKFCNMQNVKAGYQIINSHDHYVTGKNKLLITRKVFKAADSQYLKPKIVVLQADNLLSQHKPTPTELSHKTIF